MLTLTLRYRVLRFLIRKSLAHTVPKVQKTEEFSFLQVPRQILSRLTLIDGADLFVFDQKECLIKTSAKA